VAARVAFDHGFYCREVEETADLSLVESPLEARKRQNLGEVEEGPREGRRRDAGASRAVGGV